MKIITVKTHKKREVVDITNDVNSTLKNAGRETGICHLFVRHTTAALTVVPLDPKCELDLLGAAETVLEHSPKSARGTGITHHTTYLPPDILAAFIGSTIAIPISDGELFLGKFQRVVLLELNGPDEREVVVA